VILAGHPIVASREAGRVALLQHCGAHTFIQPAPGIEDILRINREALLEKLSRDGGFIRQPLEVRPRRLGIHMVRVSAVTRRPSR
jgi:hypothetical protein